LDHYLFRESGRSHQPLAQVVKQKDVIERLRASENRLAGDKEKLERQVANLGEEGEVARAMRTELQGEVARLQSALEVQRSENEMLKAEAAARAAGGGGARGS